MESIAELATKKPEKLSPGRPGKYDPDFHPAEYERQIKEGYTRRQIAFDWGVDTTTIGHWRKKHKEFGEAFDRSLKHGA